MYFFAFVAFFAPAQECFFDDGGFFGVLPRDGATELPRNTAPLVSSFNLINGGDVRLVDDDGVDFAVEVRRTPLGAIGEELLQVVPLGPLPPSTRITVDESGNRLLTFSTGEGVDQEAPAAPDLTLGKLSAPSTTCGSPGSAGVFVGREPQTLALAAVDRDPTLEGAAVAASASDTLRVFNSADFALHVAVLDLAGNLSEPTVVDVDLPDDENLGCPGCSSSRSSSGPLLLLLLLLLLLRISRRALSPAPSLRRRGERAAPRASPARAPCSRRSRAPAAPGA